MKLLNEYFEKAVFAKPTGDGLLLIFSYTEKTLPEISEYVLQRCLKAIADFPNMFDHDIMINFPTPDKLGFGISRGTACCLFNKKKIIDYSGQLLNLAARLNDLARPLGIVIDSSFKFEVIPENIRSQFVTEMVYLRSVSEDKPREIFYSTDVKLLARNKYPLCEDVWKSVSTEITAKQLSLMAGRYIIDISEEIKSPDHVKVEFSFDDPGNKGNIIYVPCEDFKLSKDAKGQHVIFYLSAIQSQVTKKNLKNSAKVTFTVHYVPLKPCN
jgi:hypothetical protein